jgi:endoglucanase
VNTELDLDLLGELVSVPGLPGREQQIAERIATFLPSGWHVHSDVIGNLIASPADRANCKMLFLAHMDEVGLLVRRITPQGFLQVERLGGMGVRGLPGARLTLWTAAGEALPAQVGVLPHHLDDGKSTDLSVLYLDIGATSLEEALAMGVRVGDGLTWDAPLKRLGKHFVSGKALDDRLGCFVLIHLARRLSEAQMNTDVGLAFVVREEIMFNGGLPVLQRMQPQVVLGVDATLAFDTPDLERAQSEIRLGSGPALKWFDTVRGKAAFVPDWKLAQRIRELAQQHGVALQDEVVTGISTIVSPLPFALLGVRTAALSVPLRYHHSPIETAHLGDVEQLINLLFLLCTDLSES